MNYENIKTIGEIELEKMTLTEKMRYIAAQQEAKGKIFTLDEINEEIADYRREKGGENSHG